MLSSIIRLLLIGTCVLTYSAYAQFAPESARANLYFPHFVVGGNPNDYWVTSFDFANPTDRAVRVWLYAQNDDGQIISVALAGSEDDEHVFDIPAYGTRSLTSPTASRALQAGWVDAYATAPIQGIATYTRYRDSVPVAKITAAATPQAISYRNIATRDLGLALAHRNETAIRLAVRAFNEQGTELASAIVSLQPWGHTAFNIYSYMPQLPNNFKGTIQVAPLVAGTYFLAWALADDGSRVNSSLPTGHYGRPVNQRDRIWDVYLSLASVFESMVGGTLPDLNIDADVSRGPNAYARQRIGDVEEIGITLALAELLADSRDELAAVLGHEMGHVAQFRHRQYIWNSNPERDADVHGTLLSLFSGYDPYALGGSLAKLSMASGQAGLLTQWEAMQSGEIHGSFNDRLGTVYSTLTVICSLDIARAFCSDYRSIYHPHLYGAPLHVVGAESLSSKVSKNLSLRMLQGSRDVPVPIDRSRFRIERNLP